ncbi:MAG: PEGA domain-containing protein, partial [Polyangiales bacterium]
MSAPNNEYERYLELADREACDETLSVEEREFCRTFEQRHPGAVPELASYDELSKLNPAPDASSRALVDRALAQLDAEDSARTTDEAKLLRRTRGPGWPTLVAVAGFALGATYALIERTPNADLRGNTPTGLVRAELVYASGMVKVSGANGVAGRTLLAQGSEVETSNGGACMLIDSDINICLGPDSRMRLTAVAGPARLIELEAGKLATRLSTQPDGMSFSIIADGVMSTAVGTAFSVERTQGPTDDDKRVVTTVLNGKVRMGRGNQTTIVNAHERAVSKHGDPTRPSVTSVRRTEEAPSWALLGPTVLWHDPVAATLEVQGEPAGADAWLDDQWLGSTPVSSLIPVGAHRLVVRKDGRDVLSRELHVNAGEVKDIRYDSRYLSMQQGQAGIPHGLPRDDDDGDHDEHDDRDDRDDRRAVRRAAIRSRDALAAREQRETTQAAPAPVVELVNGSDILRQGRQAVRVGQYHVAEELYQKLIGSNSDSTEARTALVLLGHVRLNKLNDPKGALSSVETYLQTGGPNEEEARVTRI